MCTWVCVRVLCKRENADVSRSAARAIDSRRTARATAHAVEIEETVSEKSAAEIDERRRDRDRAVADEHTRAATGARGGTPRGPGRDAPADGHATPRAPVSAELSGATVAAAARAAAAPFSSDTSGASDGRAHSDGRDAACPLSKEGGA